MYSHNVIENVATRVLLQSVLDSCNILADDLSLGDTLDTRYDVTHIFIVYDVPSDADLGGDRRRSRGVEGENRDLGHGAPNVGLMRQCVFDRTRAYDVVDVLLGVPVVHAPGPDPPSEEATVVEVDDLDLAL